MEYEVDDTKLDVIQATVTGNADVLEEMLAQGADANTRNVRGLSALAFASMLALVECVKILLQHGADVNAQASNGGTPLIGAVSNRTCKSRVGDRENGLDDFLTTAQLLIEAGADINARTKPDDQFPHGRTVLSFAGHPQMIDLLKKLGAV